MIAQRQTKPTRGSSSTVGCAAKQLLSLTRFWAVGSRQSSRKSESEQQFPSTNLHMFVFTICTHSRALPFHQDQPKINVLHAITTQALQDLTHLCCRACVFVVNSNTCDASVRCMPRPPSLSFASTLKCNIGTRTGMPLYIWPPPVGTRRWCNYCCLAGPTKTCRTPNAVPRSTLQQGAILKV